MARLIIYNLLLFSACGYAFWRGKIDARIVAATFFISGDVFYESAGMLATFVLLGHWFEMRARGGANDAIRTLLDLAPPKALVIRDGDEPVEVPTAEVTVGDVVLIRPGATVYDEQNRVQGVLDVPLS